MTVLPLELLPPRLAHAVEGDERSIGWLMGLELALTLSRVESLEATSL